MRVPEPRSVDGRLTQQISETHTVITISPTNKAKTYQTMGTQKGFSIFIFKGLGLGGGLGKAQIPDPPKARKPLNSIFRLSELYNPKPLIILNPKPLGVNPKPQTPSPEPPHPKPWTPNAKPKPQTPDPETQALNPGPQTLNPNPLKPKP